MLDWGYDLQVHADDDLDGIYETSLVRGDDQNRLKANEYFLDIVNNKILFGSLTNGGFVPNEDLYSTNNIRVVYSGYKVFLKSILVSPKVQIHLILFLQIQLN